MSRVIPFPRTTHPVEKLTTLLELSIQRAEALTRTIAEDEGTPARIAYNVSVVKLATGLALAGLVLDCKDGVLVIRPRRGRTTPHSNEGRNG